MHRQHSTRSDTRFVIGETEGDDGGGDPPPEEEPPGDDPQQEPPDNGDSPLSPVFDTVGEENAYLALVAAAGSVGAVISDTTP